MQNKYNYNTGGLQVDVAGALDAKEKRKKRKKEEAKRLAMPDMDVDDEDEWETDPKTGLKVKKIKLPNDSMGTLE